MFVVRLSYLVEKWDGHAQIKHVSSKSCLDTDDSTSYVDLKDIVSEHRPVKVADKKQVS